MATGESPEGNGSANLAITGASGRLGGRVARRLAAAGIQQRLVVRDPARAPRLPGASVVRASYGDAQAVRAALSGIETVFMVSGSETPDRVEQHRTFVDAAVQAGIRYLVYVSFYGATPDATFTLARDHWATEQHIRARGIPFVFLRDNLYADSFPMMAGEEGVIRGPAGDGRVAAVAQDDIADAAVTVLQNPVQHAGRTYELTGPAALTLTQVAATVTAVTGSVTTYQPETVEEAYASRRARYDVPGWLLDAWVSTYTAIGDGSLAGVTSAIPELTGHPARSLEDVLRQA